jgi:hypothetical protein
MSEKKLYTIVKKLPKKPYYIVRTSGDWNDADYVYNSQEYSQKEFDEIVEILIHFDNFYNESSEGYSYDLYDDIPVPIGYECSCHTAGIDSIEYHDADGVVSEVHLTKDKAEIERIKNKYYDSDDDSDDDDYEEDNNE